MIDQRLGPYRITEEIGSGGMATVYRAYQPSMDRHVAIKVIRGSMMADPTLRDRFRREARLIARLEHPHLLPVYDFDGDHDPPFIVMRYLEGGTLSQVQRQGAVPHAEILYTLGQAASALDYAHRQGVVHRDLKPSNVMIDREGNAFVTDFGIARVVDAVENLTLTGNLIGTPAYMSPEQARGLPDVDAAADRNALGVMTFELLTGSPPYHHESSLGILMAHLNDEVPSARARNPALPAAVDQVIRMAMAKDRSARYASAAALVADLAKALETRSSDAPRHLQSVTQTLSLDQLKAFEKATAGGDGDAGTTPTPSDQQRQMTTVSLDATGLAELAYESGLDPESARGRMEALWARFDEVVREAGGVIQSRSDEIGVALWGRARISEDDPERAIRAALQLREAALAFARETLGTAWEPGEEDPLPFSVGITTGPILLERDTHSGVYSASGAALMVASRLREAALPGEILLAHDTFTQVRGVFAVHPHDPIRLRGRKEPLEVYLVSEVKPRAFRTRARGIEGVETRMVGRENELRVLQEALTLTVEDGETQVVTVVGEAGLGKSRLLYEFSNHLDLIEQDVWLFEARATQPSMLQPFSLTRDLFSSRFQILDSDPLEAVHRKLIAGVAEFLGEDSAARARHIGQLVGFDFSSDPAVSAALADGEAFRRQGLEFLGEFFAAACRVYPAVVYIEDIHWADDRSLDLINVLVRDNVKLPLFVLCMARPSLYERRPQWGEGQRFHERVELEPLSQLSGRRLVRELLKKVPEVPSALRDLIVERADGNPFYIEELVRALIDDGIIVKGEPDWSVDETRLSNVRIPPTLTGVLQSRLDTLAPGLHQLLQRASVLGRVFWDAAAIALSRPAGLDEDEVQAMLEELRRREMVLRREQSGFAGTVEYVFRHAILRDVTYETLVPRQRRALHRLVGDWLLEVGGERVREHATLVAEHFQRAGEPVLAATQLLAAAEVAFYVGAHEEAIHALHEARRLTLDLRGHAIRIQIEAMMGAIQSTRRGLAEAQSTLEAVLPEARQPEHRAALSRILGLLVRNAFWNNDLAAARRYVDEALPLARESGDPAALMFVLRQAGNLAYSEGIGGLAPLEESLAIARRLGDVRGISAALNSMGLQLERNLDPARARECYEESACVVHGVAPALEDMALDNLAILHMRAGDLDRAAPRLHAALKAARQSGHRYIEAGTLESLGELEMRSGRNEAALDHLRNALAIYRQHDNVTSTVFLPFAVLEARKEGHHRAAGWVGYVASPASGFSPEVPPFLAAFRQEIQGPLTNEEFEAAMAVGAGLDLDAVIEQVSAGS